MYRKILGKSATIGLIVLVIVLIITVIWTSRGSNYHGYNGIISGFFAVVAFIISFVLSALFLLFRSQTIKRGPVFVLTAIFLALPLILTAGLTYYFVYGWRN